MSSARKHKLKLTAPKPRNPLIAPAAKRKAGAHRKAKAAQRRGDRKAVEEGLKLLKGCRASALPIHHRPSVTPGLKTALLAKGAWRGTQDRLKRQVHADHTLVANGLRNPLVRPLRRREKTPSFR